MEYRCTVVMQCLDFGIWIADFRFKKRRDKQGLGMLLYPLENFFLMTTEKELDSGSGAGMT